MHDDPHSSPPALTPRRNIPSVKQIISKIIGNLASFPAAVAVMGPTGSGKSTFINMASGSHLGVSSGLESCTNDVQVTHPFELDGQKIILVDTPGFDDTVKSDADVLRLIASWLQITYENGMKLTGIIYMHRITDIRVGGIAKRNFSMFRELCGDSTLENVAIVTTFWSEVTPQLGEAREAELRGKDIFFKPVLDKGARMLRHSNTVDSAHDILRQLVGKRPTALCIQRELVDQHLDISDTVAGAMLSRELLELVEKHKEEICKLQAEKEEAIKRKDEETRKEMEEDALKLEAERKKMQADSQQLSEKYEAEKVETARRMEEMRKKAKEDVEKQKQKYAEQISDLEKQMQEAATRSAEERERAEEELRNLERQRDEYIADQQGQNTDCCIVA